MSAIKLSVTDLLAKLVAFDTTSHKTNLPLIDFVRDYLASHGVESQLVPSSDGLKASLYATIGPGATIGPADGKDAACGGIGLSGHTDVVPVTGQDWDSDPFQLTSRDGRLYGRGSCDMKGFLACVLAMVPQFRSRNLKTPLHILFSYDEEVGCTGVRPMIERFGDQLIKPRLIIVGEPTGMGVVEAHKGATRFAVEVSGRAAHSSMAHLGANAVMAAGRMIAWLGSKEAALRDRRDERFTPPYASLQVNVINGGFAQNVIPATCTFTIDIRNLPGSPVRHLEQDIKAFAEASILPGLRAVAPEAAVEVTRTNEIPAFQAGDDSPATSLALQLAGQNETFSVSYGTEAGLFQQAGSSTVICGPGDIAQAHTANEFVDPGQLENCTAFLTRLADWCER